jgi:transposase-like protein
VFTEIPPGCCWTWQASLKGAPDAAFCCRITKDGRDGRMHRGPCIALAHRTPGRLLHPGTKAVFWFLFELFEAIKPDTILYTDGARCYRGLAHRNRIAHHEYVHHGRGQFSKRVIIQGRLRTVSTNAMEGFWGRLKTWMRAKGGVPRSVIPEYVKEYEWRANTKGKDRFIALLEAISLAGLEE